MTQTELIKALNIIRKITDGMNVSELEIARHQISGELKLRRMGIGNEVIQVKSEREILNEMLCNVDKECEIK